jgi:hypothetical protein
LVIESACGVLVDVDEETGRARTIERVSFS